MAAMRRRGSTSCSSGMLMRNGRIDLSSAAASCASTIRGIERYALITSSKTHNRVRRLNARATMENWNLLKLLVRAARVSGELLFVRVAWCTLLHENLFSLLGLVR